VNLRVVVALSVCAFASALAAVVPASAQTTLLVPTPIAPVVPVGAAGRSLGDAYRSIVSVREANPAAAQAANFQYVIARQRLAAGDVSGALAASALAQSLASSPAAMPLAARNAAASLPYAPSGVGVPGIGTLRSAPLGPTGTTPATAPVPLAGGPLSMQLLVARNEIDLAERLTRGDLTVAKARYRAALDAYQSGDAARSNAAANDAYRRAARYLESP
jgi:hypothetical protein